MAAPSVIFFDFDGVLADTENVHIASWERTFEAMGWEVPADHCARAAEIDDRIFLAELFQKEGVVGDVEGWASRKQLLALSMLRDEPRLFPGVADLLHWLAPRCRLGIVSTAAAVTVDAVLQATGLAPLFAGVIAREDYRSPKPDPEPYRVALERLGVKDEHALAVEDSATGLESARRAGLRCLAVGHRQGPGPWCQGTPFLPALAHLEAAARALGFVSEIDPA